MGTTADKLTYLNTTKEQLKTKINSLGGSITASTPFRDYVDALDDISGGGGHDWEAIGYTTEPEVIQDGYDYAVEILENWDSSITNMRSKYEKDQNLVFLPLVDTSNVTDFVYAFRYCYALIEVPLIDTSNATTIEGIFLGCHSLKKITQLDIGKVTALADAFQECYSMEEIDLDFTYAFSKTSNLSYLFYNCSELKSIKFGDIDNISRTGNLGTYAYMFTKCDKLDNDTLNRILKLLPKLRPYSASTLKNFGISQAQATICETLPNYTAFTARGWTTGY